MSDSEEWSKSEVRVGEWTVEWDVEVNTLGFADACMPPYNRSSSSSSVCLSCQAISEADLLG